MNIRQRLYFMFVCASIWGGLLGCIAFAKTSKIESLGARVNSNIEVEARSSSMLLKMQEIQMSLRELEGATKTERNIQNSELNNTEVIERKIKQALNSVEVDLTALLAPKVAEVEQHIESGNLKIVIERESKKQLLKIQQEFVSYKKKLNNLLVNRNTSAAEQAISNQLEKQYDTKLFPLLVDYRKERSQQLAENSQSLIAATVAGDRQITVFTIASIVAAIVAVSLMYRSSLKSLERSQTAEQRDRLDLARQAESAIDWEKEIEVKLTKIDRCLLNFCTDPIENINQLTKLLGELSGASYTCYNLLDNGVLRTVGQWQMPSEFEPGDRTEERICHDLIRRNSDEVWVLSDLLATKYAQSEPGILAHNINTYIGKVVKCQQLVVGCLSAWYAIEYIPSEIDRKTIAIIAAAIRHLQ